MDMRNTHWHLAFANLIQNRAPPGFDIQTEVALTIEPQRADILLLRRVGAAREDDKAEVMRTLWPRLGLVTILEYKSPGTSSFRPGDLIRLWSYGAVYDASHLKDLPSTSDLTLTLVLPSITPTLTREIARMGWTFVPLGGGYGQIVGAVYALYVVETDGVCVTELDLFLEVFSRHVLKVNKATRWLRAWLKEEKMKHPDMTEEDDGYDPEFAEMFQRLPPALQVELIAPEIRLLGLDRDQQALALPVEILRGLTEAYILSLAPATQEKIRQRLADADH
ncbi:MAG: hypothetical protein ABJE95_39005 [Byssovorax sp.]